MAGTLEDWALDRKNALYEAWGASDDMIKNSGRKLQEISGCKNVKMCVGESETR